MEYILIVYIYSAKTRCIEMQEISTKEQCLFIAAEIEKVAGYGVKTMCYPK